MKFIVTYIYIYIYVCHFDPFEHLALPLSSKGPGLGVLEIVAGAPPPTHSVQGFRR